MTQEDKDLLLKDLCARLPYGVKVQCGDYLFTFDKDHMGIGMLYEDFNRNPLESPKIILSGCYYGEDIKPYLFPLSSMTEEQKRELRQMDAFVSTFGQICFSTYDDYGHELMPTFEDAIRIEKWLNAHHFDYRGLIEKGLAIDATGKNIY